MINTQSIRCEMGDHEINYTGKAYTEKTYVATIGLYCTSCNYKITHFYYVRDISAPIGCQAFECGKIATEGETEIIKKMMARQEEWDQLSWRNEK